jgi:dihydroneopterin aldolase
MNDKICIKNLKIDCEIGVYEEERGRKQPVCFDIELTVDLSAAAESDNLNETVDYFELTSKIVNTVSNSHFMLIEKLAYNVADICLEDSRVTSIVVALRKPEALKVFGAEVSIVVKKTN